MCATINKNFEILHYIIYSIINSTDNAVQIAEVSGIASGTVLTKGKLLSLELSPSTKRFYLKNYMKRFKSPHKT